MSAVALAGAVFAAWGAALLAFDVTHPAALAILLALGGVFAVTAVIDHRRTVEADRAQVARMIERTRR